MDSNEKPPKGRHPNSLQNLVKFKPGNNANPIGSHAHSLLTKTLQKGNLKTKEMQEIIELALIGDMKGLQAIIDPKTFGDRPVAVVMVAKCLYDAIKDGDWDTCEKIYEKVTGKPIAKMEIDIKAVAETPEEKELRRQKVMDALREIHGKTGQDIDG